MNDRDTATPPSDRELLELAAKAAGYEVRWHEAWQCFVHVAPFNIDNPPKLAGQRMVWTPLTYELAVAEAERALRAPGEQA